MRIMKQTILLLLTLLGIATTRVQAQGTVVYDQESSTDEASPFSGVAIQFYGSVGQSFTPSFNAVGFVRLRYFDITPGNSLGAVLTVKVHANAINGPILGTATPVSLSDGFIGSVNFYFPSAIPVAPNSTYFLETLVQSGDNWGTRIVGDIYSGGNFYGGTSPITGNDLWFREGIVVPEPCSVLLFVMGSSVAGWFIRRKRR